MNIILLIGLVSTTVISVSISIYLYRSLKTHIYLLNEQQKQFEESKKGIIKQAKRRSGAVKWGKSIEHFAPFMSTFPLSPEDVTFMGMPIDYVGFTDTDKPEECTVHFIEVKSGRSVLSKKQWNIRKAIQEGRVKWHELSVDANPLKN
jgi:predicted Holliday junction resolvase-like endonuclease